MKNKFRIFNKLKWKIAATFLFILIILSSVYLYISVFTAEMYFQETVQKLNSEVAKHIAEETQCFVDGKLNKKVLDDVFHNVMVINPSIEVYLLDPDGKILTYFAPDKKIKLKSVSLEPIKKFIANKGNIFVLGDDPKNREKEKAFSASEVYEGDIFRGYIYVILEGEEYENATQLVFGSYIMRLGLRSMIITLLAAAIITILSLRFITRNLNEMLKVIRDFKNGNLDARIKIKSNDELGEFAQSFNEMADTIVQNIQGIKTMDNLRRELVANVSHDLRTPLASIQGYVETLTMKSDSLSDEEKDKFMNIVLNSTESLKKLVEELFELSKLEAREYVPKPEPFSLAELVQDIQQKNQILAESKNIRLSLSFDSNLPLVFADISMMEKVLQNLLDNAIKFTNENGEITFNLTKKENCVLVSIRDSGRGIPSDEISTIFNRYDQGKRIETNENKGIGLGLAIVKKILEVHRLDISVESEIGKGTVFSFNVPVYDEEVVSQTVEIAG